MISKEKLSFGQRIDAETGLVEPWFVNGAVDWVKSQNWEEKKILQYGSGYGDVWLSKKSKQLISIERNADWAVMMQEYLTRYNVDNYELHFRPCDDNGQHAAQYIQIPTSYNETCEYEPDIVIVDDAYRVECVEYHINRGRNIVLIVDNYMQSYIFLNEHAKTKLEKYDQLIFEQSDHTDNDGVNKWKTGIFFIK